MDAAESHVVRRSALGDGQQQSLSPRDDGGDGEWEEKDNDGANDGEELSQGERKRNVSVASSRSGSKALSTSMNMGSRRPKGTSPCDAPEKASPPVPLSLLVSDSAFRQQRLPAWQPILTPYNVIPTLFVLALVFIPLGTVFLIFSGKVAPLGSSALRPS